MDFKLFMDAIGTLGMPVAVAGVLVWHFIRAQKAMSDHNARLLEELSRLREAMNHATVVNGHHERLLTQNERLVEAIKLRDRQTMRLITQFIDRQGGSDASDSD